MIHILLMILKIIGIILLVVLGLLLAAVLAILFVPVRYRADLSYDGEPDGEASLTWLLHAVRLKVSFHEHADASGHVLWFRLFDVRLWPEEEEETDDTADHAVKADSEIHPDIEISQMEEKQEERIADLQPVQETERIRQENPELLEKPGAQKDEPCFEDTQSTGSSGPETDPGSEAEEELTVHATEVSSKDDDLQIPAAETSSGKSAGEKRPGIISRLKEKLIRLAEKLRSVISRIMKLRENLQKWLNGLSKKKHSFEKTWNTISRFWHDERNQKAFHLIWKRTKKLIRYILPKKISGRIHFGFDDPYDTGQALAAVSPFYGLYAKTLTLEPDFTGTALDGKIHLKGRIAVWYPLWTAARLFLDKDFRRLLKFFRKRTKREESV